MRILGNRVFFSRNDVAQFNARWPGSTLRDRSYWFEFDDGDLVDTNIPQAHDGAAALALANQASDLLARR